jgi:two-component sensor histidine kinase
MGAVIRRLASPEAMATGTLAIAFLVYVTGTSLIVFFSAGGTPLPDLVASALLSALIFGALSACRTPLSRILSTGLRAGAIVGIVLIANAVRSVVLAKFIQQVSSAESMTLPTRTASASLLTLAAMVVVGELIYRSNRVTAVMASLNAQSIALSLSRATYAERLQNATAELEASIRAVLDPALSLAAAELDPDTPGRSSVTSARLLQEILRVSVRPMIQSLAVPAGVTAPVDPEPSGLTTAATPAPRRTIDITDSIRPVLTVVPLRIIGLPVFITTLGITSAIPAVLLLTLTWPLLSIMRRHWPSRYRVLPAGPAIALLTATFVVAFSAPMLVLFTSPPQLADTIGVPLSAWLSASNVLFSVATAWFVATVFIFERSRRLTEEQLIEVNEQIEIAIARMRQAIWFTRRNLTWVLHGPVQSALVSATIRLESGTIVDAADRTAIWSSITEAYALLHTTGPADPDFAGFADELTTLWQGVCEISFDDPDSMIERVSADPSATAALIEVVREAVGNAIRHGNATSVDIAVLDSGVDLVGLVIADNGTGVAAGSMPGIGSDLFTSLAYEWSSDSSPQGTTVTADLTWSPAAIPQDSPH